ncbi:MAG TPA: hypothetical protein DD670_15815, partial [Planctomycetaceae bacterium]|nr:hypothetical protein [Planctomycetaceae bacterium]
RRANRGLWKLRGKAHYSRMLQFGWPIRTAMWTRRAWPRDTFPDVIWAISSSNLMGVFAGRYLSKIYQRPFVMELHDPPLYPDDAGPPSVVRRGFSRCVRQSAAIVTTTHSYARYLSQAYKLPDEHVVPIYLSYRGDIQTPLPKRATDRFVFLHAGSLTTSRGKNARTLLEALAVLFKKRPSCQPHIRLRLLGGGEGTAEFRTLAAQLHVSDALECLDEVPREQFRAELDAADVLLVIKYVEQKYDMQIPGKLFEYLGTGKPILGLMRRTTEGAEILQRSGLGTVPEFGQVEALSQSMLELWDNRERLHAVYRADQDYVRQFSSDAMVDRVDLLLNRLAAKSDALDGGR